MFQKMLWMYLCYFSLNGLAVAASAQTLLWEKLNQIQSLHAAFNQKVETKNHELSQSTGTFDFVRPKHFRWETKSPMKQLIVADGKKFWVYDVELDQVTVRKQSAIEGALAGLFLGENSERFFQTYAVTVTHQNHMDIFQLRTKQQEANIQRITIQFGENNTLQVITLYDQLGQKTIIRLRQSQYNKPLSPNLFQFVPPAGVDVVEA